ncbi:MAG: tol-pal system protein YbgF [Vicinamibacterales bacterium]
MTHRTIAVSMLVVLLGGAGTAHAQNREHLQMMAEIRMMQEQAQQLATTLAGLGATLQEALKAINARLDEAEALTRRSFADQKLALDGVGTDLRVVRERVDETTVRVSTLGQEIEALRTSIPVMPPAPFPVDPADPNAPPTDALEPAQPIVPSTAGLSPTRMFETAWADYTAGQWSLAITGFEAFLKTFPRSEMADEAQFYVGETHFAQNRFAEAVAAYNQVIQGYPGSNSLPLAYYKRGLAQERLGEPDAARASWEQVIATYPDSDAGRLARQNLDRLGRR